MVSVIIPVYNAENTLLKCVDSVLNQTYSDYELILIDDGSKDRSGEICDELKETCASRGVRCQVIHKENGGVSSARNCGLDHANGEYFVCVDSDDVIEPCYLMDLVQTAEEHPELRHVLCGFKCTSNKQEYIFTDKEPLSIVTRRDYMLLNEKILVLSPCLALYKSEIVKKYNVRMPEDISLAEDLLFNMEYLDALGDVKIGVVNKSNYTYKDENESSLNRKFRQDLLDIYRKVFQSQFMFLTKWGITDEASWGKYYETVLVKYQGVLKNTFNKQNPMSFREKIKYNNNVLSNDEFREALQKNRNKVQPMLRRAYESGNFLNVLFAERVQNAKHMIHQITRKLQRGKR